jgi:hypothetical protein
MQPMSYEVEFGDQRHVGLVLATTGAQLLQFGKEIELPWKFQFVEIPQYFQLRIASRAGDRREFKK